MNFDCFSAMASLKNKVGEDAIMQIHHEDDGVAIRLSQHKYGEWHYSQFLVTYSQMINLNLASMNHEFEQAIETLKRQIESSNPNEH